MKKRVLPLFIAAALVFCGAGSFVSADENESNLVAGLSYTVETGEPISHSYANYTENGRDFDADSGQLTDGIRALADESDANWYRAFRGESRVVAFDLGDIRALTSFGAGFLHYKSWGIYAPRYLRVFLSRDGETYSLAGEYATGYPLHDGEVKRCEFNYEFDKIYAARYIKVEFCCDIFAYCDEIEVFGSTELSGDESDPGDPYEPAPGGYPASAGGIKNIIKLYNGYYPTDQSRALLTEDMLLPYIAYVGTDGKIIGRMFDCVAFVPCHGDYPSGGRLTKTNGKNGAVKSDWDLYLQMTFASGYDLDALDKTVAKVCSALGSEDRFKVLLTMPYPTVLEDAFGDIDGDGSPDYCRTLDEREAICEWFAGECISAFGAAGYENLELAGFYWYREEVNYSDSDHEDLLVKEFNRFAKEKGYITVFDPFYLSVGYDHWEELGFSAAVMQPNAAFYTAEDGYFDIEMLEEFAFSEKKHNLGVEIETEEPALFSGNNYLTYGKIYESYLYYGAKTGYMDALKTFYQGAGPGTLYDFCHAQISTPKGLYLRRLYDITYNFLNGVYSNEAPTVSIDDFETVSGAKRIMVDMTVTDHDSYFGDVTVSFPKMPEHGYVVASAARRSVIYSADEDFVGEDSFTVIVSDGFNSSQEITVHVNVIAPEPVESSAPAQESGSEPEDPPAIQTTEFPGWAVAVVAVLASAIVAVAVVMIVKKTSKRK